MESPLWHILYKTFIFKGEIRAILSDASMSRVLTCSVSCILVTMGDLIPHKKTLERPILFTFWTQDKSIHMFISNTVIKNLLHLQLRICSVEGNQSTQRKHTQTQGEHAKMHIERIFRQDRSMFTTILSHFGRGGVEKKVL